MQPDIFNALVTRLDRASTVLKDQGCLMQSLARRYYLVFTHVVQAAEKHGVVFREGSKENPERRTTHDSLWNFVRALYTGQNSGPVLGGGPGIAHAGALSDRDATSYTNVLQKDRKYADYGYTDLVEPYDRKTFDEHMGWADKLVEDLRTLL
jgi:hypothetical protein